MDYNELIVKQQLKIEELKQKIEATNSELMQMEISVNFICGLNRNDEGVDNLAFNFVYESKSRLSKIID